MKQVFLVSGLFIAVCFALLHWSHQLQAQCTFVPGSYIITLPDAIHNPVKQIPVDIIISDSNCKKNILVLPGWNFSRKRWIEETSLRSEASKRGYNLILPEMAVTIYESNYYPETKRKWAQTPGSRWIKEILVPTLQKRGLLLEYQFNAVMGLSTGGRGAVLTALYNKGIFKAAASLSGDFDQTRMPNDKLMAAVYGPYEKFKVRWQTADNPYYMIDQWEIPLYLGHGTKDGIVPFEQTKIFYETLKKSKPECTIIFNQPANGHDFIYWNSEVVPVLEFFDDIYKKEK
ncbi:MAG: alpha/beta hydrolase-fold protein [Spirochaetes bacterium]|nr:alpha/beta hydrolase-fold protein [Spirochaetota bacterium]